MMPTTVFQADFFKVHTGWPLAGFVSAGSSHGGGLLQVLGIILHHGGLPAHVAEAFAVDGSCALAALGTGALGRLGGAAFLEVIAFASSQFFLANSHSLSASFGIMMVLGGDALEIGIRRISFNWPVA